MAPTWLPSICVLCGDVVKDTATLYVVFRDDFVVNHATLEGLNVTWDKNRDVWNPYDNGFIHLITRDSEIGQDRRFDDFRAERLPWCKPLLSNCGCSSVLMWDYLDRGKTKTYLWLEQERYVLVLQKMKKGYYILISGHHVDGASTARSLHAKYKRRV